MTIQEVFDRSGKTIYRISQETGIQQINLKKIYDGERTVEKMALVNAMKLAKSLGFHTTDDLVNELNNEGENKMETLREIYATGLKAWKYSDIADPDAEFKIEDFFYKDITDDEFFQRFHGDEFECPRWIDDLDDFVSDTMFRAGYYPRDPRFYQETIVAGKVEMRNRYQYGDCIQVMDPGCFMENYCHTKSYGYTRAEIIHLVMAYNLLNTDATFIPFKDKVVRFDWKAIEESKFTTDKPIEQRIKDGLRVIPQKQGYVKDFNLRRLYLDLKMDKKPIDLSEATLAEADAVAQECDFLNASDLMAYIDLRNHPRKTY